MMDDKTRDDLARAIRAILYERDQAGNYVNWDGAPDNEKAFWREAAHAAYSAVRIKPSSFREIKAEIKPSGRLAELMASSIPAPPPADYD